MTIVLRTVKDDVEFYTVEATGESGISQTGLSILAGVNASTLSRLSDTLLRKAPSEVLEPFVGKALTLLLIDPTIDGKLVGNLKVYTSTFCAAVLEHYASKKVETALFSLIKFASMGINTWIQGVTGWKAKDIDKTPTELLYDAVGRLVEQERLTLALQQQTELHADKLASYDERLQAVEAQISQYPRGSSRYYYGGQSYPFD